MIKIIFVVLLAVISAYAENEAIVVLISKDPAVTGTIKFVQEGNKVKIEGSVDGLSPGKHGFHVHSKGDVTKGCDSTGSHFNPSNKTHGAPDAEVRHVGDLGNIEADDKGHAEINITDEIISLKSGTNNVVGRAIVVHLGQDDLGLTDHPDSKTTGNAGGRVACGIIGIASDDWDPNSSTSIKPPTIFFTLALLICTIYVSAKVH